MISLSIYRHFLQLFIHFHDYNVLVVVRYRCRHNLDKLLISYNAIWAYVGFPENLINWKIRRDYMRYAFRTGWIEYLIQKLILMRLPSRGLSFSPHFTSMCHKSFAFITPLRPGSIPRNASTNSFGIFSYNFK